MSTLRVSNIQDTSGGNTSTPAGIANGIAKVWVNFNGTGTVAVRASYNVSSITDLGGTGSYQVNFTTLMPDADFSCVAISDAGQTSSSAFTAGAATITTRGTGGSSVDSTIVSVAVFR